jgi:hypothetical protein
MKEITEDMKRDNWAFFVLARSSDPSVMIPNTRKLVSNLIASMTITNEKEFNGVLIRCLNMANDAWVKFSRDSDWGAATQDCETILDQITPLIYDPRWAFSQPDSFVAPGKSEGT